MQTEEIEIIGKENKKVTRSKRKFKKLLFFQTIFCLISILFILGCFVFYGNRLIKYYKIYNPKTEKGNDLVLLSTSIINTSKLVYEGDGLYKVANGYLYKGLNPDNYINFSGLVWRILKINSSDGTIDLILNDYINVLKWNSKISNYDNSDINKYLNDKFVSLINKDLITNTVVCDDIINDINSVTCNEINSNNLVRLLNINEFLNSKLEGTFINDDNNFWLANRGKEKIWNINGINISFSSADETYGIKPVITLKNSNILEKGKGSEQDPYVVKENVDKLTIGKYIKLGNDVWTVYDFKKDKIKLALSVVTNNLESFNIDSIEYDKNVESSVAYYLNNVYYDELTYKDLLQESEWYVGEYKNSYKDIYDKKVKAKIGLLSVADIKFDNELSGYYLLNGNKNKIYLYMDMLVLSKPSLSRTIRPAISIKTPKIVSGLGTKNNPYVLGE